MIVVLGSGVAGISCALAAAQQHAAVLLVTPGEPAAHGEDPAAGLFGGNTALAQGGIAAALGIDDRPSVHAADTVAAGAGLVDEAAAAVLCEQGAAAMRRLITQGFAVDRDAAGALSLGLEAAHSRARIVHAGEDRAGAALHAFLAAQLRELMRAGRVQLAARSTAISLLTDSGAVTGAVLRDEHGLLSAVRAEAVVIATGGYASLYNRTSNHAGARGQGIVLAAQVGAVFADLEFVQFHPTVLDGTGSLISEAVRGAGAVLLDDAGKRFMLQQHDMAELAPRDIVSRAAHRVLMSGSRVWLDATAIERDGAAGALARRFPVITAATRERGFDWTREPVPVAPAAHYTMGGIVTDLDGRTSMPGLFAAGEVASTGVHGANRLASNSLLEGLVFGRLAAHAAVAYAAPAASGGGEWRLRGTSASQLIREAETMAADAPAQHAVVGSGAAATARSIDSRNDVSLGQAIDRFLGIERDADGLAELQRIAAARVGNAAQAREAQLAMWIAKSAEARTESRGAHYRSDFQRANDSHAVRQAWRPAVASTSVAAVPVQATADQSSPTHRSVPSC